MRAFSSYPHAHCTTALASHALPDKFCKGFLGSCSFWVPLFLALWQNKSGPTGILRTKKLPAYLLNDRTGAAMLLRCHLTLSIRIPSAMYQHTCSAVTCSHVSPTPCVSARPQGTIRPSSHRCNPTTCSSLCMF